jgi:MFS transporter, DHA1 family, tetracycline resistance protein
MTDVAHKSPRQGAFNFILVTIIIDVLSFGVIIPVLPLLIKEFANNDTAEATRVSMVFGIAWAVLQFFASPILGCLSDKYGRRPIILFSNFGNFVDLIMMALAPTLAWLFLGRLLSGITAASFSTAQAYVTDVTPPEKRTHVFGLMGATWGIGFVLGPIIGGLIGELGPRAPFWVAGLMALANFIYGVFVLPESLALENRKEFSLARANPFGVFKFLRTHNGLLMLASIYFLSNLSHYVYNSIYVYYVNYRYGWTSTMVGISLGIVGISGAIVQGILVKRIAGKIGERRALLLGLLIGAIGMSLYAIASAGWHFLAIIPFMAFWGLAGPTLQQLATAKVEANTQGELQGAFAGLMSVAGIFGTLLFPAIFSWAVDHRATFHVPGAPFFVASILLALAAFLAWTENTKLKAISVAHD